MRLQRLSDGESVHLDPASRLSAGGFGRVFGVVGDRTLAAKVYNKSGDADARKLKAMIALGPSALQSSPGHCSLAWPIDLLAAVDDDHRIVGFLMPRVAGMRPIADFFDPATRDRLCPHFS